MTWLVDDVFSIRVAAARNLQKLSEEFGESWSKQNILPRIDRLRENSNYLQRMTALYAIQVLVHTFSAETIESSVLPVVVALASVSGTGRSGIL